MKSIILLLFIVLIFTITISLSYNELSADNSDNCDVQLYVANNTLFEIFVNIDGIDSGKLLPGKNKTYTSTLIDSKPKRIKVKVSYNDPDELELRSINYMSKKIECDQTDSIYIAFKK